jgi:hypothetical protein
VQTAILLQSRLSKSDALLAFAQQARRRAQSPPSGGLGLLAGRRFWMVPQPSAARVQQPGGGSRFEYFTRLRGKGHVEGQAVKLPLKYLYLLARHAPGGLLAGESSFDVRVPVHQVCLLSSLLSHVCCICSSRQKLKADLLTARPAAGILCSSPIHLCVFFLIDAQRTLTARNVTA